MPLLVLIRAVQILGGYQLSVAFSGGESPSDPRRFVVRLSDGMVADPGEDLEQLVEGIAEELFNMAPLARHPESPSHKGIA